MYMKKGFLIAILAIIFSSSVLAERAKRPMVKNKVTELGLEIWTEYQPEWITDKATHRGRTVFTAQTPPNTYPPAAMTWATMKGMQIPEDELEALATSTFKHAAKNYRLSKQNADNMQTTSATYGDLTGYETTFTGIAHGDPVDVKAFVGQKAGNSPVVMQVYTLKGRLPHIKEHIRRSWTNVRVLK